jgi:ParB family chromosome partitioning protein
MARAGDVVSFQMRLRALMAALSPQRRVLMSTMRDQKRLGKGLAALIHGAAEPHAPMPATEALPHGEAPLRTAVRLLRCDAIQANPFQPRAEIPEASIDALAESIRQSGLIQPVTVRQTGARFELIAGERRWRAAQRAGMAEIPALVRTATDEEMLEIALIENIFREDLNAIDRARAYRRYCEEFGLTAEQVAGRLGEDRTTVANYLRLLELPESVQAMVRDGQLSMGHARALAGLTERHKIEKLAAFASANFFSVRALEELVRQEKEGTAAAPRAAASPTKRPHVRDLEQQFVRALGTKVEIQESRKKGAGRIVIHYFTLDDFDRIAERLGIRWE